MEFEENILDGDIWVNIDPLLGSNDFKLPAKS